MDNRNIREEIANLTSFEKTACENELARIWIKGLLVVESYFGQEKALLKSPINSGLRLETYQLHFTSHILLFTIHYLPFTIYHSLFKYVTVAPSIAP